MKRHECIQISQANIEGITQVKIENIEGAMFLSYSSFATEYDVKTGKANHTGKTIGEFLIAIKYRPYCGQDLQI